MYFAGYPFQTALPFQLGQRIRHRAILRGAFALGFAVFQAAPVVLAARVSASFAFRLPETAFFRARIIV